MPLLALSLVASLATGAPVTGTDLEKLMHDLFSSKPEVAQSARQALIAVGAPAVPALLEKLDCNPRSSTQEAVDPFDRAPDGNSAIVVDRREHSYLAAAVLAGIGPPALPALIEALNTVHETKLLGMRRAGKRRAFGAITALWTMGPAAKAAAPALLEFLQNPTEVCVALPEAVSTKNAGVTMTFPIRMSIADARALAHANAAATLLRMGAGTTESIPLETAQATIVQALRGLKANDIGVAFLVEQWPDAQQQDPAGKYFAAFLDFYGGDTTGWFRAALRQPPSLLHSEFKSGKGVVASRMSEEDARDGVTLALGRLGRLDLLLEGMGDSQPAVRRACLRGLDHAPQLPQAAHAPACAAMGDESVSVRALAAAILANESAAASSCISGLTAALSDVDASVRREAANALGGCATAAAAAIPALKLLDRDPDKDVRKAAKEALKKIR